MFYNLNETVRNPRDISAWWNMRQILEVCILFHVRLLCPNDKLRATRFLSICQLYHRLSQSTQCRIFTRTQADGDVSRGHCFSLQALSLHGLTRSRVFHPPSVGSDEEYIYMNKVTVTKQQDAESQDKGMGLGLGKV